MREMIFLHLRSITFVPWPFHPSPNPPGRKCIGGSGTRQTSSQLLQTMRGSRAKITIAGLAIIFGTSLVAPKSAAQNFNFGGGLLQQNIFLADRLAEDMTNRYGNEIQFNRGCSNSIALYQAMKTHCLLTDQLIIAYRGTCSATFKKAADAVRDSLNRIQVLRTRARVSDKVCGLIRDSWAPTHYAHKNAGNWKSFQIAPVSKKSDRRPVTPYRFLLSRLGVF